MTDPIEIMARAIVDARGEHPEGSQHHFVDGEMHSATFLRIADHNARAAISALVEAGYAIVPMSGTVDMVAAFWRQKNTGSQEVGHTGPDRHDMAAMQAAIEAGRVKA